MIELKEQKAPYLAHFERRRAADEPDWLRKLRSEAMGRFSTLGFPTTHDEDWKYTNLSQIARTLFEPALPAVSVNRHYSGELASVADLPPGVTLRSLADALRSGSQTLEAYLGRHAGFANHAFVALNSALFEDGIVITVDRDVAMEQPIVVVYTASPDGRPVVTHPRTLIVVGRGSRASIVEVFAGPDGTAYFTNAVTEIVAREGAVVDYCRIQDEGDQAFHIATVQAVQDRASVLNSHNFSFGAALARHDINSVLDAEGAECVLNGLFVAAGKQHVDNHTLLDHAKPNCSSRELFKGILSGQAGGVFNGKIIVRKDAQKTNAIQSNRNLLLSGEAVINTKPQLEIFADDVRCTHGATVGQLDQEALFYLRTRGIPFHESRNLLTHAFAAEVTDLIRWQPLREALEAKLP